MEFQSKSLGKINNKKCYINNGKYGFYLTHDSKIIKFRIGSRMIKWTLI